MKQKTYYLGLGTTLIVFLGTLFKVNHWPGAGPLLFTGILILVFIFLPVALVNNYKTEGDNRNRILYISTWLTSFVVFISMLFKIQHWAGAGIALIVSLPFPYLVFLPVFLFVTSKNRNHNIYNTVSVLFLLLIISCFSALLALNVSKEKMVDSLGIARNYTRMENALNRMQISLQSPVIQKIDELILTSDEYKNIYLDYYDITSEQWNADPEVFIVSGSLQKSGYRIREEAESVHIKLLAGLSELILLLEKTPGCEGLATAAPVIFGLRKTPGGSYNWESDLIFFPVQPWLFVYLDGLETNLKMIKATIK
jgi:hypothetical protein